MNSQRLMIMPVLLSLAMITIGPAFAAESISTMSVGGTCGVTIGTALDFGTVAPSAESNEGTLLISGTGSTPSLVSAFATDWLDTSDNNIVNGENTKFSDVSGTFASKTALNSTDTSIPMGTIANQVTNSTYWQVELNLNDSTFQGDVSQTLTIEVTGCV